MASSNVTHNLRDWQQDNRGSAVDTSHAKRFSDWVDDRLTAVMWSRCSNTANTSRMRCEPTPRDEHLLTLFTTLGAAGDDAQQRTFQRGITDHVIGMDGYAFDRTS